MLGLGSFQRLLRMSSRGSQASSSARAPHSVAALACGASYGPPAVPQRTHDACSALRSAPELSDLQRWTHWDASFGKEHGGLRPFLMDGVRQSTCRSHAVERHYEQIDVR